MAIDLKVNVGMYGALYVLFLNKVSFLINKELTLSKNG